MQFSTFPLPGPALISLKRHEDGRGYFFELWRDDWFRTHIADQGFVQDNQSLSIGAGTVRGLHYQSDPAAQGKLIRCVAGAIFDVAVDIRPDSSTYGQWISARLTADNGDQLWVPEGFAHGFCTLEPMTVVCYKVTRPYCHAHDKGIAFDDPDISIDWPVAVGAAILSEKDRILPSLSSLRSELS